MHPHRPDTRCRRDVYHEEQGRGSQEHGMGWGRGAARMVGKDTLTVVEPQPVPYLGILPSMQPLVVCTNDMVRTLPFPLPRTTDHPASLAPFHSRIMRGRDDRGWSKEGGGRWTMGVHRGDGKERERGGGRGAQMEGYISSIPGSTPILPQLHVSASSLRDPCTFCPRPHQPYLSRLHLVDEG